MEEDTFVCSISKSPLSFTSEFILNSFLHVTILFIFLNGLFYFIIVPLSTKLARDEIGHQIVDGINKALPLPINFNTDGIFNCDTVNNQVKGNLVQLCTDQYNSNVFGLIDCTKITDPIAKLVCQQQSNIKNPSTKCNEYIDQMLKKNCDQSQNMIDSYIKSTPTFASLNINNADDLYSTIYSLVDANTYGNNILDNYILQYSQPNSLLKIHNDAIINYGIQISIIFFIITITLIIFLKYACNKCINVTKLLLENCITFIFVGGIEYWFFMTYAFKYIPAPPSTLITTAIDTVKSYLIPIPEAPFGYTPEYALS